MNKYVYKIIEFGYLIIAVFFIYQSITIWHVASEKAYLYALFAIVTLFMYFFKRNFRKKFESRNDQDS